MNFTIMFINKSLYNGELLIYNYYEMFRMYQISLELKIEINNIEYAVY